jgi:hypothetical protein
MTPDLSRFTQYAQANPKETYTSLMGLQYVPQPWLLPAIDDYAPGRPCCFPRRLRAPIQPPGARPFPGLRRSDVWELKEPVPQRTLASARLRGSGWPRGIR